MVTKVRGDHSSQLLEASRQDLLVKSRRGSKTRFRKRLNYQVSNFKGVDLSQLFNNDYFVFTTPINNYACTIAFPGVLTELRNVAKSTRGDARRINLQLVIKALRRAFDKTDDVKVRCSCPDFCLTGDTEIKLLEGISMKIEDLLKEFESGRQDLWVYSVDEETHDFRPGHVSDVWISGYVDELIEVTLDNGEVIKTTPNHLYMLRDGTYKRADELVVGQSLMPLYFQNNTATNGYECVKYNSRSHGYNSVYKEVAQYELQEQVEEAKARSGEDVIAIHHKNFNKLDNRPENLYPMGRLEHWKYHSDYIAQRRREDPEFDRKCREASSKHCYELNANPTDALIKARSELGKARCAKVNNDPEKRAEVSQIASDYYIEYWASMTPEERSEEAKRRQSLVPDLSQRISEGQKQVWESYTEEERAERGRVNSISLNGEHGEKASKRMRKYWDGLSEEERSRRSEISKQTALERDFGHLPRTEEWSSRIAESQRNYWASIPKDERKKVMRQLNTPDNARKSGMGQCVTVLRLMQKAQVELSEENYEIYRGRRRRWQLYFDTFSDLVRYASEKYTGFAMYNHNVVQVKVIKLEEKIPVYDLTVDKYNNFLVSSGVILHNCYRFMHFAWKGEYLYGDPEPKTKEYPKITNPNNSLGATCKHLDLFLSNKKWLTKAASVVNALIKTYPDKAATYLYDEDEIVEPEEDEVVDEVEVEETPTEDKLDLQDTEEVPEESDENNL